MQLTQYQNDRLLELLWGSLRTVDNNSKFEYLPRPRVQTGWGDKTKTGLLASIERIINEPEDPNKPKPRRNSTAKQTLNYTLSDVLGVKGYYWGLHQFRKGRIASRCIEIPQFDGDRDDDQYHTDDPVSFKIEMMLVGKAAENYSHPPPF